MPEAVATQASAAFEGREALLECAHRRIGERRDRYCLPRRRESRRRLGALSNTKLEVNTSLRMLSELTAVDAARQRQVSNSILSVMITPPKKQKTRLVC